MIAVIYLEYNRTTCCRYTEKDIVESQLRGNPPFWAFVWPGGYGLTRYISENPHLFWNKTVVDFGCGCGSASVAAWRAGCRGVLSNDIDPLALLATSLNCNNNLGIQDPFNICCSGVDYLYHKNKIELFDEAVSICERQSKETKDATAEDSRILLVGDMLYDHDIGPEVMKLIERLINNKWIVYIGEPGRDFALKIVQKLGDVVMSYQLPQDIKSQNNGLNEVTVRKLSLV